MELLSRHAGQRRREDLLQILHRQLGDLLKIAGQHSLEWLDFLDLGLLLRRHDNAAKGVDHLGVHWMRHPERALLIESGSLACPLESGPP